MYCLTAESHGASQTISSSQNSYIHLPTNWSNMIIHLHVTLVRAYFGHTCLVLPVDSVPEPGCEALHNIGYTGLGMCRPTV